MPVPGCFQYCSSVVEFQVRDCDASRSSFIVQDCFGYPGFFAFPNEVEYHYFEVFEELSGILMGTKTFLIFNFFSFLCMGILPASIFVHHMCT